VAIIILFKASRSIIERKRAENALERSEAELRVLTFQLFQTQEEERKRLALEIKDSIGQSLSAIKYRVETALEEIGQKKPVKSLKSLEPIVPVVMETVEEVRKIQTELRPSILDELGLLPTVAWFCREVQKTYPEIHIKQKIDMQETDVPDPLKIVIFRVMQEALNNIAKHSQANLALLSLRGTKSRIEFTINDNGVGFDVDCVMSGDPSKIGFGLLTMKERVELSGGSFLITARHGTGTTIQGSWEC
jgi:signal transduction histidine kinase